MESSPFWNPESTELESGIQCSESGIHRVESRIQDCHGFPYMGRAVFGSYFLQTLYFYMWLNAVLFKQMLETKTVKIVKINIQFCYFTFCWFRGFAKLLKSINCIEKFFTTAFMSDVVILFCIFSFSQVNTGLKQIWAVPIMLSEPNKF